MRERSDNPVLITEGYSEARAGLFKGQGRSRKLFSPLLRSFEASASLFRCKKNLHNAILTSQEVL